MLYCQPLLVRCDAMLCRTFSALMEMHDTESYMLHSIKLCMKSSDTERILLDISSRIEKYLQTSRYIEHSSMNIKAIEYRWSETTCSSGGGNLLIHV